MIRSSTCYLQRKLSGPDDKVSRHLGRIDKQISICDAIVSDLLEYKRGRGSEKMHAELNPWPKRLLDDFPVPPGLQLTVQLATDVRALLYDQEKMRRAMVNLVTNALQALASRKEQAAADGTPCQPRTTVRFQADAEGVIIQVEDNGTGMNAETADRAFEPLFSTKARGTGLGLPIVKKVVADQGGAVDLESVPKRGTRVTIFLPLTRIH